MARKEYQPEFVPNIPDNLDAANNFEQEFTNLSISPDDAFRAKYMSQNSAPNSAKGNDFADFTFVSRSGEFASHDHN